MGFKFPYLLNAMQLTNACIPSETNMLNFYHINTFYGSKRQGYPKSRLEKI